MTTLPQRPMAWWHLGCVSDNRRQVLIAYDNRRPKIDSTAYVQHSAQIIGDVEIGAQSSVWFNVVMRGDVHFIRIGARTNIQDNSTLHVTTGTWPTLVGDDVTVGHGVILHGCRVGNRCLVGMGAIVIDDAEIGDDCLVAAGALVTPASRIAAGHLIVGRPAKAVRPLRDDERARLLHSAQNYVAHAAEYRKQGIP